MNDLLTKVAKLPPHKSITICREQPTKEPWHYEKCQQCNKNWKLKRRKTCAECRLSNTRPPIVDDVFIIEGEPCRLIPLTKNKYAIVDVHKYELLMQVPWCVHKTKNGYYAVTRAFHKCEGKKLTPMHDLIIVYDKNKQEVDHINHNTLDYRESNLRPSTHAQNLYNSRIRSDNTTGYKGVCKRRGGYVVRVGNKHIGDFKNIIEAAKAYDRAALRLFGEFACVNFPGKFTDQ